MENGKAQFYLEYKCRHCSKKHLTAFNFVLRKYCWHQNEPITCAHLAVCTSTYRRYISHSSVYQRVPENPWKLCRSFHTLLDSTSPREYGGKGEVNFSSTKFNFVKMFVWARTRYAINFSLVIFLLPIFI